MMTPIFVRAYNAPAINKKEVLRYSGTKKEISEISALLDKAIGEAENVFTYKVCYRVFDATIDGADLDLGFATVRSRDLAKNLAGCKKIMIFAATVGTSIDRTIARASITSPSLALMLDALATERIEALCDVFCEDIEKEYGKTRPRFSAGYGDLPLELQREIFTTLNPQRNVGVVLNDNMFMSPSKSVTAIIGIEKDK